MINPAKFVKMKPDYFDMCNITISWFLDVVSCKTSFEGNTPNTPLRRPSSNQGLQLKIVVQLS